MDLQIRGRTAVVTGASRGIGAATAALLEAEGARVVGVSRATGVDITAPDAAERIAELAGAAVDILVNNAGTSFAKPLDELTDDDWNGQWELHVLASMRLMRAFAPGMAERGWGRIVNVASSREMPRAAAVWSARPPSSIHSGLATAPGATALTSTPCAA